MRRSARPGAELSTLLRSSGSHATVLVVGEIDLLTAPALRSALEGARLGLRNTGGHANLRVDLRNVSFLGAAGLSVLADAQLLCGGDGTTMRVVSDQHAVRRPMELTGLEQLLTGR